MTDPVSRIAVIHPRLAPGGGSEAAAAWILQALQDEYRLTVMTLGRPDLAALDVSYGTSLAADRIEIRALRVPAGMNRRFDALRSFRLARYIRRRAKRFDAMISAYGLFDLGRRGIQRIGDFSFDDGLRQELHGAARLVHRTSLPRALYLGLGRALAGGSPEAWKKDLIVANSEWTRKLLWERFGVPSRVVYPPVFGGSPAVGWEQRADGFVLMARLVPEKGILSVIEVLREVRRSRPLHLHVLGRREDRGYVRELEKARHGNEEWLFFEGEVRGAEKARFLADHKYGISGCRHEAFGIAVAEMVKAGCLVWVPDGGGQTEIVAHQDLIYKEASDAIVMIRGVLADPTKQAWLREHLRARAGVFSTERFVCEMKAVVRSLLEENHAGAS